VAGGALAMSAGTSFHERRKPNGSACQRRTMAGVQDEAKHAITDVAVPGVRAHPHQTDHHTGAGKRWRPTAFLLLGSCGSNRIADKLHGAALPPESSTTFITEGKHAEQNIKFQRRLSEKGHEKSKPGSSEAEARRQQRHI